jgi:hypothetical protein
MDETTNMMLLLLESRLMSPALPVRTVLRSLGDTRIKGHRLTGFINLLFIYDTKNWNGCVFTRREEQRMPISVARALLQKTVTGLHSCTST